MNEVIDLLNGHRSIRKFREEPVSEEELHAVVGAAQHASTSSNIQAYSVIHVKEQELKDRLAELAGGQAYVKEAPVFLVWCADLLRLTMAAGLDPKDPAGQAESTELFIAAVADAALASQNAAVAAESLGLGIVYIGGIRNRLEEVCRLLNIPEYVLPLFGMCVGRPDQDPMPRPRLPLQAVLHENRYSTVAYEEAIRQYDEATQEYYRVRTGGQRTATWSQEMKGKLLNRERDYLKEFVRRMGFDRT